MANAAKQILVLCTLLLFISEYVMHRLHVFCQTDCSGPAKWLWMSHSECKWKLCSKRLV